MEKKSKILFKSKGMDYLMIVVCLFWIFVFAKPNWESGNSFLFFLVMSLLIPLFLYIYHSKQIIFYENIIVVRYILTGRILHNLAYDEIKRIEMRDSVDSTITPRQILITLKSRKSIRVMFRGITTEDFYKKIVLIKSLDFYIYNTQGKTFPFVPPKYTKIN